MKFLNIIVFSLFLSSCSFLPKLNFGTPGTVPQQTEKGKQKSKCDGEAQFNPDGSVKYCSDGYYNYEESYNKQERKMTFTERIKTFINNLFGWSFWIFVALLIFAPGVLSFLLGKLVEGTIGVSGRALKATSKAITRAKRNGGNYLDELKREHEKDKKVKQKINKLRADIEE